MKERAESISSMAGLVFAKKNCPTLLERPVRVVKQVRSMPNLRDLVGRLLLIFWNSLRACPDGHFRHHSPRVAALTPLNYLEGFATHTHAVHTQVIGT
jgi:hypothetical protein